MSGEATSRRLDVGGKGSIRLWWKRNKGRFGPESEEAEASSYVLGFLCIKDTGVSVFQHDIVYDGDYMSNLTLD